MENESSQEEKLSSPEVPWTPMGGLVLLLMFYLWQLTLAVTELPLPEGHSRMGWRMTLVGLGLFLLLWGFVRTKTDGPLEALRALQLQWPGFKRFLLGAISPLFIGLPVLLAFISIQGLILYYFDVDPGQQPVARWLQAQASAGVTPRVVFLIFLVVVTAPVTEELLFRGVLYLPIRQEYGPLLAATIVSLIFAGVHGYLAGLGHLFILAMILTWLLEATDTMFWPILGHGLHNGAMIAIMLLKPYIDVWVE